MDEREHRQIELIISDELASCSKALNQAIEGQYAYFSSKGRLRSGATIKQVIATAEEVAVGLVESLIVKVEGVAINAESFELVNQAVLNFFDVIQSHIPRLRDVVGRNTESVSGAVDNLISDLRSRLERKLEINRYRFESIERVEQGKIAPLSTPTPATARGGRLLAQHWDSMWAATAAALHMGDLLPKKQADIENFMQNWLESHGHPSNTSTVRGRARRLWQLIEADL